MSVNQSSVAMMTSDLMVFHFYFRLEFVCHVLEQSALLGRELSRQVLSPAPVTLVMQVVKVHPQRFSQELIIRLFDTNSSSGRKNMARWIK